MALVCLCRGNFYWPPHTTILFCSIFLDKIVLDTLKSRYHRSAPLGIAKTMYTRHTVLSQMLMELGVDEKTATEDACRIEHVISEKSFAAVQAHLEQVTKMREDAHGQ